MTESHGEAETILIAEDERIIARYLEQILVDGGYTVVETVTSTRDVAPALARHRPAVLLLDISMESASAGLELAESEAIPESTALVFVSAKVDEATMTRVQRVAPAGFVVKPFTEHQVLAAVRVALGHADRERPASLEELTRQLALCRDVLSKIAREVERASSLVAGSGKSESRLRELAELGTLSPREWEVLRGLVSHRRPPAIARELFISHHTVRNHLKSIFAKLGVHTQAELLDKVLDPEA